MGSSYVGENHHEIMGRTAVQTSEAENVRSETTKDKASALLPAVQEKAKTGTWSELSFPDSCAKSSTASVSNESVLLSTSSDCTVVTFVSDEKIPRGGYCLIWAI